jgi:hypothetical protein
MKKYKVILHEDAETDISSAFEWGRRAWARKMLEPGSDNFIATCESASPQHRSNARLRRKVRNRGFPSDI